MQDSQEPIEAEIEAPLSDAERERAWREYGERYRLLGLPHIGEMPRDAF